MKPYLLSSIFLILFESGQCYDCQFFNNITVSVIPKTRVPYAKAYRKKNFSGCFEHEQFDQAITQLSVVNQNIEELGEQAVHSLPELTNLAFSGCGIKKIHIRAFEDLPKLRSITIIDGNLTSISPGVFNDLESLEEISLYQNQLSGLTSQAIFGQMPSLKYINMSKNKIRDIDVIWFLDSFNITLLDFSYNQIQYIGKFTFQNLHKLKDLLLDYNEIKYIENGAFQNITNMEILTLRHNRITHLSPNIIGDKFQVELLRLNGNFLNFLPRKLLEKMSVGTLELEGNPWKCPCLKEITSWMDRKNVTLKNNRYCKDNNIPECLYSTKASYCSETVDSQMTELFLKTLRDLDPPIDEECANLDEFDLV